MGLFSLGGVWATFWPNQDMQAWSAISVLGRKYVMAWWINPVYVVILS